MRCVGFRETVRKKRKAMHLTQAELGEKCGLSARTIQNYELGVRMPRNLEAVEKLSRGLEVPMEELLGNTGMLLIGEEEKTQAELEQEVSDLVDEITSLFAGGELSDSDLDGAMEALSSAYWLAKSRNRRREARKKRAAEAAQASPDPVPAGEAQAASEIET